MKQVNLFSEGKVSPQMRKAIKDAAIAHLNLNGIAFEENARGELYTQVAVDAETGTPIYAKVDLTISTLDMPNREKPTPKAKEASEEPTVSLFD